MKVQHESSVIKEKVETDGAKNANIQWLIGPADSPPNFALRRLTLGADGATPFHKHDYEHEVFILSGTGILFADGSEYELKPGVFALVDPGKMHQFKNTGENELIFLCIIPIQK